MIPLFIGHSATSAAIWTAAAGRSTVEPTEPEPISNVATVVWLLLMAVPVVCFALFIGALLLFPLLILFALLAPLRLLARLTA